MEIYVVNITNLPVIFNGNIEIRQVAEITGAQEITAEETFKKEEFSDEESFKIENDMQEEIKHLEEKREVMPMEQNDPEKCIFTDDGEFKWVKVNGRWRKRKNKKRMPFSCNHCEFIGNNATELRKHKRDMDSLIFCSGIVQRMSANA